MRKLSSCRRSIMSAEYRGKRVELSLVNKFIFTDGEFGLCITVVSNMKRYV